MKQHFCTFLEKAQNNIHNAKFCLQYDDYGGAKNDLISALSELGSFVPTSTPESLVFQLGYSTLYWALNNDITLVPYAIQYCDDNVMPAFKEFVDQYQEI